MRKPLRKALSELVHRVLHTLGDVERIRTGRQEDANQRRRLAIHTADGLVDRTELDAIEGWIVYPQSKRIECFGQDGPLDRSRFAVDLQGLFDL